MTTWIQLVTAGDAAFKVDSSGVITHSLLLAPPGHDHPKPAVVLLQ